MNTDKLNKWADLLLDTGKRNNLINFKDTKMSTVEILSPDLAILFRRVANSALFEVYDPKLRNEEDDFELEQEDLVSEDHDKNYSKEQYLEIYGARIKRQQILIYNNCNKPISALKSISKKAKSAIEETGVNIAYMAIGFINWTENENSQYVMRAPILLVPISVENESAVDPYFVRVIDDEIIVNPTFSFKLQNDYGIKLPDIDDEENIDAYFEQIESLVSKLNWTVTKECKIGIFSFLKINMYKDLKDNAEKIVKNENVRVLLGDEAINANSSENGNNSIVDLLDLHNVVDADSSQAEAIEMAKCGKSFVLQGPPGTGKSQTITNIIAECLLDGKKVLFVSEKLAALSVVYDKLKKVGLEEFCLELHSHKANKKQVISELCHTLKLQKSGVSEQAEKELKARKAAQQKLDAYTVELHKIRPSINKTLYHLYEDVSSCRSAPDLDYVIENIKSKGEDFIEKAETALNRYVDYVPSIGYNYHLNIWYGYKNPDCSYQTVMQLKTDLLAVNELCKDLIEIAGNIKNYYGIEPKNLNQSHAFHKFFALAKESNFITPLLLKTQSLEHALTTVKQMQALAQEVLNEKAKLNEVFDEDIYKLDGQALYKKLTKQFKSIFSRLFNSEYKRIISDVSLCKKCGKKLNYKNAVKLIDNLRQYQQKLQEFDSLQADVQNLFGQAYTGINTDFDHLISEVNDLLDICSKGVTFGSLVKMSKNEFVDQHTTFAELAQHYEKIFAAKRESEDRLVNSFNQQEYDIQNVALESLINKCTGCHENTSKLDNWCEFFKLLQKLKTLELRSFIDYAIDKQVDVDKIVLTYKKLFYTQWVDAVLHDSPVLLELARVPHDEAVKRFREKDELNFEINKAKIKANLSAQRPNLDMIAQGSSIAILLREGEKKRKQKGIRVLLSELGELAQTLKPCFLMSPLSVSTFLDSDIKFDVVIFDEASQIFPQDAIGAIYRGKQLIVVGDSKQMPPSNFFNSVSDLESDDETEDITDFESILDLCSTSFPQRRLKWHYRSRFEQLISFSNKNFYDNDLVTFPSSKTDSKGIGVDYIYVNGIFDRKTKTNRAEAERIVDLVFENFEKYPERSLGVVAFSMAQQNLIDKLISKRRQQDPSKESFFKSDKPEPFFVKNLETVQGDERDTIIFSIAYAKDSQGRLLLNFGPINRAGGERRLNVAVTRAKYNVQLVSSMHYTDIDLSRTQSVGAKLLREYLDYAENGAIALERTITVNPFESYDSEFEMEVCDFLREKGYTVDTQVGCSSFKIDLAIKRPDSSDYVLAVECDGATYHSSKTARDRDRLRQDILERMGWKFYRIWSTDWFRNKSVEKERLLSAVKEAFANVPKISEESPATDVTFEETVEIKHFEFPKYRMANVNALCRQFNYDKFKITRAILEIETPVAEEWLLKRIVFLFGREKVTNVVRNEFDRLMWNCGKYGIIRRNGFLYLQGKEIPMLRMPADGMPPREIKYIAIEELAKGLKELLKQNVTAEKMGLFKLLASQLGFSRMGDSILARLESALGLLSNEIESNGEMLSLIKQ